SQHLPANTACGVEVGPEWSERRAAQLAITGGGSGRQGNGCITDVAGSGVEQHRAVVADAQTIVADAEERDVERQGDVDRCVVTYGEVGAGNGNVRVVVRRLRISHIPSHTAGGSGGRPGGNRRERATFSCNEGVV